MTEAEKNIQKINEIFFNEYHQVHKPELHKLIYSKEIYGHDKFVAIGKYLQQHVLSKSM